MKKMQIFLMSNLFCLLFTMTVFAGTWEHDQQGWWYQKETGSYPTSTWQEIDNKWYYFNEDGYMQTGWIQSDEKWYYCGLNGGLVTEHWISGMYYVGSDGAMYVDTTTPDGKQVNKKGEIVIATNEFDYNNYAGIYIDANVEAGDLPGTHSEQINIIKIDNGKIYGNLYMESYYDEWIGDFRNGVPIENGIFTITVEARNHDGVSGELISHNFMTDTYELSKNNGNIVIKRNGNIVINITIVICKNGLTVHKQ